MQIKLVVVLFGLFGFLHLTGQEVEVYETFEEFEELLSRNDGETYVVNFWATWCAPCIKELPYFESLGSNYRDKGVTVVLTSLDFKNQLEKRVLPFVKKKKLKSQVVQLADPKTNDWIGKINENWSGAIPATLIYSNKRRTFLEREFTSYEDLEHVLLDFMNNTE